MDFKAQMTEQSDHRHQIRFSLRDLMLVTVGSSALIAALGWIGRASEQGGWFYAVYSIPIIGGMVGLLVRQFWGGVVGAFMGGVLLMIVLWIADYRQMTSHQSLWSASRSQQRNTLLSMQHIELMRASLSNPGSC